MTYFDALAWVTLDLRRWKL